MGFGKNVMKGCLIVGGTYFVLNTIIWALFGIGRFLDDVNYGRYDLDEMRKMSPKETFMDGVDDAIDGFKWYGNCILELFKKG